MYKCVYIQVQVYTYMLIYSCYYNSLSEQHAKLITFNSTQLSYYILQIYNNNNNQMNNLCQGFLYKYHHQSFARYYRNTIKILQKLFLCKFIISKIKFPFNFSSNFDTDFTSIHIYIYVSVYKYFYKHLEYILK